MSKYKSIDLGVALGVPKLKGLDIDLCLKGRHYTAHHVAVSADVMGYLYSTFEAIGGVDKLAEWASRNEDTFFVLYMLSLSDMWPHAHPDGDSNAHPAIRLPMSYDERERLKEFARMGVELREAITMVAHWHRQHVSVPFDMYAANWALAGKHPAMRLFWPMRSGWERMIADDCSDWGTYKIYNK